MTLNVVLIFTKVPLLGLVKTRLTQGTCLNDNDVVLIARAMLKDTIVLASKSNSDRIDFGYIPKKDLPLLKNIIAEVEKDGYLSKLIEFHLQYGKNFDERFGSVVRSARDAGAESIVVLGADLPYLDPYVLNKAFEYLSSDKKNLILGSSSGGGIYLVGLNHEFDWNWFARYQLFRGGIELSHFAHFCRDKDIPLIILPPFGDVDVEEDLVSLIAYIDALSVSKNYEGYHFPNYTADIIKELGLNIVEVEDQTRYRKIAKK